MTIQADDGSGTELTVSVNEPLGPVLEVKAETPTIRSPSTRVDIPFASAIGASKLSTP